MSGQDAQRGFIYQTIVAMIECLDKPDWDAIKLEPETENDKVDISFYANGRMLRAIQVKSSRKAFERADVKNWLDAAVRDAQSKEAEEVWLYLVGGEYKDVCKDYIAELNKTGKNTEPKKHIKTPEFEDVKTYCIGKLCGLHGELITSKEVHWTYHTLLGIVHENSISSRKLSRDEFRAVLSDNIKSASKNGNDLKIAKTVRKLSGNLWINWKTGRLGDSLESALYGSGKDECILDSAGLRLLSVLVQGEGAVVGWDELVRRGIRMNAVMEALRNRSRVEEESPAAVVREPGSAEAESDDLEKYPSAEEEKEILQKALETAGQYIARGVEIRLEEVEPKVRKAVAAVRRLCGKAPALSGIVKAAEKGTGFRIVLPETGIKSAGEHFPALEGSEDAKADWANLCKTVENGFCDKEGWLERSYANTCESFENGISNAGGKIKTESKVFGNYRMAQAYMNAYAQLGSSDQSEALLDHVEKWYRETRDELSIAGNEDESRNKRVLVLHGQPGDGKTTFCKKAVYAHCFEGWLTDAPNVLRVSLNKSENLGIMKDGKVSLPTSISLKWNSRGEVLYCAPDKLQKGTLVIFDGYDELAGELAGDKEVSTFAGFYECVSEFAKDQGWFVVITSRTMCIRRELEEKKNVFGQVDSFAPLTTLRQEMMIDRMIELDNKNTDLRSYQEKEFPELRQKDELKDFLGIPILFRMIVAVRFKGANKAQTMAGLYGSLFNSLMDYRGKKTDKANILKGYEDIAAGIFDYNDDTCPLNERMIAKNKELTYLFLTKSELDAKKKKGDKEEAVKAPERGRKVVKKEGQVGFLHRSFYQYFLARYLVSRIQGRDEGVSKEKFLEFMLSLRARMIEEPLVWQFVYEISMLKGTEDDPFWEADDTEPMTIEDIKRVRKFLDNEMIFAECITGANEALPGSDTETKRWYAAENAIFNVTGALSAAESACRDLGDKSDGYKGYENICRLLRRGYYHKIYLEKADFSDCNLVCANLAEAHMAGICLSGSKLKTANLIKADLKDSNLSGANLEGANLAGALLNDAHFEGADFTKADLSGADLNDANFDWTDSEDEEEGSSGEKQTILREANLSGSKMVKTHLKDADLERAILENADLSGALLEGANLSGAKLAGADLTGAKMAGADLSGADLRGACLIGTDLNGVNMEGAHLADTDLTEAKMAGADLAGAALRGACLIGADLTGAHMEGACLDRAILKGAILTGAYLERTSLIGAELVGANLRKAHLEGAMLKGAYLDALLPGSNESLSVSPTDNAAKLEGDFLSETDREDKYLLSGADINGAYLSDGQYQYAKKHGALGQPYILTEGGNILFGGDSQKPSMIAAGMGGIVFGRYKQGKNGEVLPLRWRVLAVEYEEEKPKRALLITEKLIDCRMYHNRYKDITWAKCDLKKWLNEVFFLEAFSNEERLKIDLTRNANPPNMKYDTDGGEPTEDKVFLLSLGEAKKYFHSDRDRMAEVTKYAITQGSYFDEKGMGWWWLRSPGSDCDGAACVRPGGGVLDSGHFVDIDIVAVRPALWLNL